MDGFRVGVFTMVFGVEAARHFAVVAVHFVADADVLIVDFVVGDIALTERFVFVREFLVGLCTEVAKGAFDPVEYAHGVMMSH